MLKRDYLSLASGKLIVVYFHRLVFLTLARESAATKPYRWRGGAFFLFSGTSIFLSACSFFVYTPSPVGYKGINKRGNEAKMKGATPSADKEEP